MKKIKIVSLLLSVCVLLSGCFSNGRYSANDEEVIEGEANLSQTVEITPEVPKEPEPEPEPEPFTNEIGSLEELSPYFQEFADLSSEQDVWGPGVHFDSENKPTACTGLQEKYGKYSADFIRTGEEHKGKIYLTFDEGYENGYTSKILDVLKEKEVSAVFFVTLSYAKSEPELVQRMIDEGHVVGNHSARHPNLTNITMEEAYAEVADLHNYISENFDYDMYLFRPPEGAFSERTLALLQKMNYRTVCWSFAYNDWDPENQMEHRKAFEKITNRLHDGEIMLLHAVSETNTAILGDLIDHARENGFTFEKYLPEE